MSGAAFFDLDRTLLQGGTGPLLSRAMYDLGVVTTKLPGEKLLYGIFDTLGETLPSIFLARQATLVAKGRAMTTFDDAAERAAQTIADQVHPFALTLIEQHKAAGRPVVLATTTPKHLIQPLADRLGFDHVIATRYRITEDGRFDGSIRGPFVWSTGKLAAVRHWAAAEGIDLAESYAYSDSIYDTPLLSAVGNPAAVNPDPRLTVYALARQWPIVHFDVSPGVWKIPVLGIELQSIAMAFNRPELLPFVRFDVSGAEHIPRTGPVILAGNHRSYFDLMAFGILQRQTGRTARMLGKKEVFDVPVLGPIMTGLGGIRVDRGSGDGEALDLAGVALEGGEMVVIFPQGTIPRGHDFFDPVLKGHSGAARLAALSHAPVIPFGMWGTDQVWPRSASMPDVLNWSDPPTVTIRVGPPVDLKYRSAAADTRRIMSAIRDLLPEEAQRRHTPTEDELRRTYPKGRLPGERKPTP